MPASQAWSAASEPAASSSGRLEAVEVDEQVGLRDGGDVLRRELQVVGLGARRRQRGDGDAVAADPGGRPLERVEAGDAR